jgi:hypothetical protein
MEEGIQRPTSTEKGGLESNGEKDVKAGYAVDLVGDQSSQVQFELDGEVVNASGHKDQLKRQYNIWSLCGLALNIDNAWIALGGSLAIAISKPPLLARVIVHSDLPRLQIMEDLPVYSMNS